MKKQFDLSELEWKLSGSIPYLWRFQVTMEIGESPDADVVVHTNVPGSVQFALREAGILPDWNVGLNARNCEWVENRHWMYETIIPDEWVEKGASHRLCCLGLDYSGWLLLNGKEIAEFCGTHIPHIFDLTPYLHDKHNVLRIVFDCPPRWLGQFGYTSRMTEWKTRFNYTWDWMPRLVQIGIWDSIYMEMVDSLEIQSFSCTTDVEVASGSGILKVGGRLSATRGMTVNTLLSKDGLVIRQEDTRAALFASDGIRWQDLPVELWWPNQEGEQPLYTVTCTLLDDDGKELDKVSRRVGFRNITWAQCDQASEGADPWICVVNGRPVFLQGVNFPPVLPNYADAAENDYRKRLEVYSSLGVNILRINACGFLEKECFFDLCDELGIMVWQEFPLTSSGVDNFTPCDKESIDSMAEIAKSFIERRGHHASLILWGGGNEQLDLLMRPLGNGHPMLAMLERVIQEHDPSRRFVPTSPSGPRCHADKSDFGKGLNWDVHGPWKMPGTLEEWVEYWQSCDALFYSELGSPGACSAELIRQYAGELSELPISADNPLWRNPVAWWVEPKAFETEYGRQPESLEEYVGWSQQRQADALTIAVEASKRRFPACGGVILWTGHDCYPCPANTSILDFNGDPKPAALALANIWRDNQ